MKKENITEKVAEIVKNVKKFGDSAVVSYTKKFDKITNFSKKSIKVHSENINLGKFEDKEFLSAISTAIQNVKKFHEQEYKNLKKFWWVSFDGITLYQKLVPVESVGVYIPGGQYGYNYVSTIVMSVVPAQVAKVKNIVVVTPPRNVSLYYLATLKLLGIKETYAVGGVQGISALAFGTETIPKVDLIIGPGNVWVTEAKRQLYGIVGIDLLAGPSEVVVVADKTVPVETIVYELLSQAEHDKNAKSYLVTTDKEIISLVKSKIERLYFRFVPQIKFILCKTLEGIVNTVNTIAPEHLTVLADRYCDYILKNVTNAGAIFLSQYSSAVYGDYIAGPSHILPTGTAARFSSGLSVATFLKRINIVKFSSKGVKKFSSATIKLAEIEGMKYHKETIVNKTTTVSDLGVGYGTKKCSKKRN